MSAEELIARVHALADDRHYGEALSLVAGALARTPHDGELLLARSSVLFEWGRIREAHAGFRAAEAAGVTRVAIYLNLAWTSQLLGLSPDAERHARMAVAADPANADAHFALGTVLQSTKRHAEAIASYQRTLECSPDHAQAMIGVATCMIDQKDFAQAETWARRAVAAAPDSSQLRITLAVAISSQQRYEESLEELQRAAALESDQGAPPRSMVDTGFALGALARYGEALDVFAMGLPDLPDLRAHGYYAFLLLTLGHLREGWAQCEFRWMQEPHISNRPGFSQAQWAGQDLHGKTILMIDEQGAGDIIHFARLAKSLKAMGATVLLVVRPDLAPLAAGFTHVDKVYVRPSVPQVFDYHIHLMSIPHLLGIELGNIPADVPYLTVDPFKLQRWAGKITGSGLKVGLAWAGNPKFPRDNFRSIALSKFVDLWRVENVRYFSLQKPLREGDRELFPPEATLVDLGPELADFMDTAAVIAQLDLVICVDTAIAHLAGALGKPVWLLLPEVGDFRWLEGREDSPWYPTMRLFRQRRLGEWEEVVERVANELRAAAITGSVLPTPTQSHFVKRETRDDEASSLMPKAIAQAIETRHGILQYFPDADRAAKSIAWYGEDLQGQLDLLSRWIPKGAHVLEAGSGIGTHTVALARMAGAEGHVLAYESDPRRQQVLHQNIDANGVGGVVTQMRRPLGAPGSPKVDRLDDLLLDRLDLLKIREGAPAAEILEGASASMWRLRPMVFIGVRDAEALGDVAERVRTFGYRCWRLETPLHTASNYNRRDTDIFNAETALALLAIPEEMPVTEVPDGCTEVSEPHPRPSSEGEQSLLGFLRKLIR